MKNNSEDIGYKNLMYIYELYPDMWLKKDGTAVDFLSLADELLPYVRQLGCTHLLLSGEYTRGTEYERFVRAAKADGIGVTDNKPTVSREFGELLMAYISVDPYFRKGVHDALINAVSLCGADTLISLTSTELTRTPVDAAFGSYDEKFANLRLLYTLMMTVPRQKHLFMGGELAPFKVWNGEGTPEWLLLDFERHRQARTFTAELGQLYLSEPALWGDFEWLLSDADINVIAFRRGFENGDIIAAFNFSPVDRYELPIGADAGKYRCVFSTDAPRFGGQGRLSDRARSFGLPGLSAVVFKSENNINIK